MSHASGRMPFGVSKVSAATRTATKDSRCEVRVLALSVRVGASQTYRAVMDTPELPFEEKIAQVRQAPSRPWGRANPSLL